MQETSTPTTPATGHVGRAQQRPLSSEREHYQITTRLAQPCLLFNRGRKTFSCRLVLAHPSNLPGCRRSAAECPHRGPKEGGAYAANFLSFSFPWVSSLVPPSRLAGKPQTRDTVPTYTMIAFGPEAKSLPPAFVLSNSNAHGRAQWKAELSRGRPSPGDLAEGVGAHEAEARNTLPIVSQPAKQPADCPATPGAVCKTADRFTREAWLEAGSPKEALCNMMNRPPSACGGLTMRRRSFGRL